MASGSTMAPNGTNYSGMTEPYTAGVISSEKIEQAPRLVKRKKGSKDRKQENEGI